MGELAATRACAAWTPVFVTNRDRGGSHVNTFEIQKIQYDYLLA